MCALLALNKQILVYVVYIGDDDTSSFPKVKEASSIGNNKTRIWGLL